jgi:predicted ATPase
VSYSPSIRQVDFVDGTALSLVPASITFVVGPNNGGKSTFLRELMSSRHQNDVNNNKWIDRVSWELGKREEFSEFLRDKFESESPSFDVERRTGDKVLADYVSKFYDTQRLGHPDYLVRLLDAKSRISLSDRTEGPDVIRGEVTHPYHAFFYHVDIEEDFSNRIELAFGKGARINRTGARTIAHLGVAPSLERLSAEYEQAVLTDMTPVDEFGDGVRSYLGLLLNFAADPRPVTIIDEPEAFLHPPQAFRLGREIADLSRSQNRQAIIATHSSDLIKGAISSPEATIQFVYMDHSAPTKYHVVDTDMVQVFGREPFLVHTDALDALFYSTVLICEADADIMFFKWALSSHGFHNDLDEIFWIPSYGKSAAPNVVKSMRSLGVRPKCVFDIDVLLSTDLLVTLCQSLDINIKKYLPLLHMIPGYIKVPPVADTLNRISTVLSTVDDDADDESRASAIREIKKTAEALSKSWSLKATGLRLFPKGDIHREIKEFIDYLAENGILILKEGEIENYVPEVGGHGRTWVRRAIEHNLIESDLKTSLLEQFSRLLPVK